MHVSGGIPEGLRRGHQRVCTCRCVPAGNQFPVLFASELWTCINTYYVVCVPVCLPRLQFPGSCTSTTKTSRPPMVQWSKCFQFVALQFVRWQQLQHSFVVNILYVTNRCNGSRVCVQHWRISSNCGHPASKFAYTAWCWNCGFSVWKNKTIRSLQSLGILCSRGIGVFSMSSRSNLFAAAWPRDFSNTISSLESLPTRKKDTKGFGRKPGSSKWQLCGRCCSFAIGTPLVKRSVLRRSVAVPESDGTLGVPERYSSEDWSEHIRNFPFSIILKRIRSHLAFNALFALCIHVFNFCTGLVRPPPLALLSACSTALGLLLVFRTTAAYERWCAGYRCVRETKQHLQQLRRLARLWMSEEDLEWMDGQLATFPAYLGTFLGGGVGARGKSWALLGEMERDPRDILVTCGEGIYKCLRPDSPTSALYVEAGALWGNFISSPCKIMQDIHFISPFSPQKYVRFVSDFWSQRWSHFVSRKNWPWPWLTRIGCRATSRELWAASKKWRRLWPFRSRTERVESGVKPLVLPSEDLKNWDVEKQWLIPADFY